MTTDVDISVAQSAANLGARILAEHRPDIAECRVLYLFTTQQRKSRGKRIYAATSLLNPLQRFLSSALDQSVPEVAAGYDALVLIDHEAWTGHGEAFREALIDHELMHLAADPDDSATFKLRGHDVEEFVEILQRRGVWAGETESDLAAFVRAAQQLQMPMVVDGATGEVLADAKPATNGATPPGEQFERHRATSMGVKAGRPVPWAP